MPRTIENKGFTLRESDVFAVSATITLDKVDAVKTHCFAGVQFFADAEGTTPATPGAGTVTIMKQTANSEPVFEPAGKSNVIQAATPQTVGFEGNVQSVEATPSGVTVATHYRLRVTCNES